MTRKIGEFIAQGGRNVGWVRGRAPANDAPIAIGVYQDAEGHWYIESGDGDVSYLSDTQPEFGPGSALGVLYSTPKGARGLKIPEPFPDRNDAQGWDDYRRRHGYSGTHH